MTSLRPAEAGDLAAIIELTRANRQRLAQWSPTYFNPREGADEGHAGFLGFLVSSPDHRTVVADQNKSVVGFFVDVEQPSHRWVDDLCVVDDEKLTALIELVVDERDDRWVTCVSAKDKGRAAALSQAGLAVASRYLVRALVPNDDEVIDLVVSAVPAASGISITSDGSGVLVEPDAHWPVHTFGGRPFDPSTPGALVISDRAGGLVIGSPGVSPPIYDPGGPTCVVDRVGGPSRRELLEKAVASAAARGDAQLVVVVGSTDHELWEAAESLGFTVEVEVFLSDGR